MALNGDVIFGLNPPKGRFFGKVGTLHFPDEKWPQMGLTEPTLFLNFLLRLTVGVFFFLVGGT